MGEKNLILAIILGKIKNELEQVGDIDKLLNKNKNDGNIFALEKVFESGYVPKHRVRKDD